MDTVVGDGISLDPVNAIALFGTPISRATIKFVLTAVAKPDATGQRVYTLVVLGREQGTEKLALPETTLPAAQEGVPTASRLKPPAAHRRTPSPKSAKAYPG